ncbi:MULTISPECIES: AraC family transcriptional regulator [unclassified Curtobacterium]|uniref:helix-turn-helix domain-containing protein n=1 Tax=unclassified Curtobacterium TaxID=257496 RepID=UPI000F4C3EDD|nr:MULTISPECIES: AraC family transcriptional regulator [unclassified Curtobacterium]ROP64839.1 AraC-like DNA-binding protein [Curtobacterium sp. ZW137]TCK63759.1 AraC-like DNA-binding protein [Curtobacterium sp. PhB136]
MSDEDVSPPAPDVVQPGSAAPTARLSRNVREALRFLHEHAQERISVPDVAAAVHLSPRGLQKAFQREVGVTPGRYLRALRLDGVRRELQSARPTDHSTVAEIAQRWHFSNAGRMAAEYRSVYGSAPSAALRYFEPDDEPRDRVAAIGEPGSTRRRFRLVLDCEIDVEDPGALLASAHRRSERSGDAWQGYRPDGGTEDLVAFLLNDAVRGAVRDADGLRLLALNPLLRVPEADGSYAAAELPPWTAVLSPPGSPRMGPRVASEPDQEDADG